MLRAGIARSLTHPARVAIIVAVAIGAAGVASGVGGAAARRNGPIAFAVYGKHAFPAIFLMDADGSHKHRISPARAQDFNPAFSPSGTRIAYDDDRRANGRIGIMHTNGSHRRLLTQGFAAYAPSFAPGGRKIAFYGFRHRNADIYTIATNGKHLRRVTTRGSLDEDPAYSPNGKLIAFDSVGGGLQNFGVLVMHADGSHRSILARVGTSPSFSRDGRRIVYGGEDSNGIGQLFAISPTGRHRRQLTHNTGGRIEYSSPCYSPNGKRIVFTRAVVFRNGENDDIFEVNADGSHLRRLTHGTASLGPSWGAERR
jgi:Tol biopolymer transport system component